MGVRGPALGKFLRLPPLQRWKTAFFVKVQGTITCFKSPFHEKNDQIFDRSRCTAESSITNSRVENIKITKSRA